MYIHVSEAIHDSIVQSYGPRYVCCLNLRTAPSNSWANPVERIMSIVNTGLQGVRLVRQKMADNYEKAVGV